MKKILIFFFILLSAVISIYSYQESIETNRPQITINKTLEPPKIDGRLDDACWSNIPRYSNFIIYEPVDGNPSSEKTEVMLAYDKENLYVAFHCMDRQKNQVRANIAKRDLIERDDNVAILIDTFNSQRRAYQIESNPLGIQGDGVYMEGKGTDSNVDIIFHSNGEINDNGYTVELAIPFKSLRFPPGRVHTIGFGAIRNIIRRNEWSSWPPRDMNKNTILDQIAIVQGLEGIEYSKNIEILPTFTAMQAGELDSDGVFDNKPVDSDFGIGFKYGVTPNVTIDFAYNPDFSQVEADQAQVDVNLRYELYFDEKRPFFLEGKDIFSTRIGGHHWDDSDDIEVFYSRRIIDPLYGAKISGKIGRNTFGFISALDEGPGRSWFQEDNPYLGEKALVNILRTRHDLFGNSYIGFMMTNRNFAERKNNVVGIDGSFNFKRKYNITFQGFGSFTTTEEGEKLSAPGFRAMFSRRSRHLSIELSYKDLYTDFQADTGFIRRTDIKKTATCLSYRFFTNKSWILVVEPEFDFDIYYDHNGVLVERNSSISFDFEFPRNTAFDISYSDNMERWGGVDFNKKGLFLSVRSEPSKYFYLGARFDMGNSIYYYSLEPYLGYSHDLFGWFTLRPIPPLKVELEFRKGTFWQEKGGELVYDYNIIYNKNTYLFSKNFFLRSIIEYNAYRKRIFTDILLSYMLNYGTVFFFGYGSLIEKEQDPITYKYMDFRESQRSFFVKVSYLWRL